MKKQFIRLPLLTVLFCATMCLPISTIKAKTPTKAKAVAVSKVDKEIDKIVAKMTVEEKANFLCGVSSSATVLGQDNKSRVPGAAGQTYAIPRLKVPQIVVADGPAGLRISPTRKNDKNTYYATAFPVGTLLACTWNTPLVGEVGKAMGHEVKEYGVDVLLGPGVNIQRNPLCGRNFEYYSEDPVVAGKTAAAMINGIQSNGVGTSMKHFAANNQETNRLGINEHISERAMREIYLHGFEIAVKKAQPWTIMSSYNKIDGTYASERKDLLTNILRDEWGFKGIVMTDWFGGYNMIDNPGFGDLNKQVSDVVAQVSAGNDLLMPGMQRQRDNIIKAIKDGSLSIKDVDRNVKRILRLVYKSPTMAKFVWSNKPNLKEHAQVARNAAAEGMVLLKNDANTLPLSTDVGTVATFGTTSYNFISGGTGSGDVNEAYTVSLIQGLNNANFKLDKDIIDLYTPFVVKEIKRAADEKSKMGVLGTAVGLKELELDRTLLEKKAKEDAVAIITIGRNSGEGADRKVEGDFNLRDSEQDMISQISEAFHAQNKKVVVILNVGGVVETSSWRNKVDAILLSWQPGQEGGNSVADILVGKVSPSGKLTMTFPVNYYDCPSASSWLGTPRANPREVAYKEGIYVGYRYYTTFGVKPSYEFGYGLSYTTFNYSNFTLSSNIFTNKLTATVTITNIGKTAGKEVAELYLVAPKGSIDKPAKELKAYAKTNLLRSGESQVIELTLNPRDLASFHENEEAWIADKGQYQIQIGASSEDVRQTATFSLPETRIIEKVNPAFKEDKVFTELRAK